MTRGVQKKGGMMKLVLLAIFALIAMLVVTMVEAGRAEQGAEKSVRELEREQAARSSFWDTSEVKVVTVKGHEYIIVNGSNRGGIVHSESCPCKNGGVE